MSAKTAASSAIDALDGIDLDEAHVAVLQLRGLVAMTMGEQGESFRMMNDKLQESFMWAVNDLVDRAARALGLSDL